MCSTCLGYQSNWLSLASISSVPNVNAVMKPLKIRNRHRKHSLPYISFQPHLRILQQLDVLSTNNVRIHYYLKDYMTLLTYIRHSSPGRWKTASPRFSLKPAEPSYDSSLFHLERQRHEGVKALRRLALWNTWTSLTAYHTAAIKLKI